MEPRMQVSREGCSRLWSILSSGEAPSCQVTAILRFWAFTLSLSRATTASLAQGVCVRLREGANERSEGQGHYRPQATLSKRASGHKGNP